MQYLSFETDGRPGWGAVAGTEVIDLGGCAPTLMAALTGDVLPASPGRFPRGAIRHRLDAISLLTPLPDARRIFGIGLNYASHREETGRRPTAQPVVFVRFASSLSAHGQALIAPPESASYDFEGELAVVIGRAGRRVREQDALDYVAGYSCFMDGSIREFQSHTNQYTPGKNFDHSGAFGPSLVSADEVGDPNAGLRLRTRLNGETVQDATTDMMLFPVRALIAYLSSFTTLQPGDVIATGTPGGVGFARKPPLYMKPGDTIEVEIERIGVLKNTVVAE